MSMPVNWIRVAGFLALTSALAGGTVTTLGQAVLEIGVSGRANAHVSIATSGSFIGVAWAARTKDGVMDIYAATSRDGGRAFTPPVRVNHVAGAASASGEQPPRIALLPREASDPSIVVLWTAKSPRGTRLVSARSNDGGRSFGSAQSVPGSDASGNRGWESMAVTAKGEPVVVWLDHREVPARPADATAAHGEHQHGATTQKPSVDGVARAQLSQIFFAGLNNPASAKAIAPGVCYCCKTSVAAGSDGSIVTAWRHVYPGNIRDIALAKSMDGGRTFTAPVRVSDDNWVLDGCPENGPAVAVDQSNAVHVVWPTLIQGPADPEPTLALFYAMSKDGRHFTKRQPIPTGGMARHPQIALGPSGTIAIVWDEQGSNGRRVVVARGTMDPGHPMRFTRESVTDAHGVYPAVAATSDGAIVAWTSGTEESVLRVERLLR
jgi:hypothetical protein